MSNRPELAVAAIVTDEQGRVLLIRRGHPPSAGRWTVPGGRVERGETLRQALARELLTETGLTATPGPLAEVFELITDRYHYVILDYRMTEPRGELRAGDDATDARFVALCDLPSYETTDGLAAVLERALGAAAKN
mgnify:CR=1 FL=1